MKKIYFTSLAAILLAATTARAGGYQLQEYSLTNLGRSFAGAGIVGDDYSAIAFNPAGMSLNKSGMQFGAIGVDIHSDIKQLPGGTLVGEDGKLRNFQVVPHFFGQYAVNDAWRVGLGVYVPFGLATDYNKQWFGKTHALLSKIQAVDIAPALSYQPTRWLTIGGSLIMEHLSARLTNDGALFSNMNADSNGVDFGYSVGVMVSPTEDTRFGLVYRSKISHYIKGKHYMGPHPTLGIIKGTDSAKLVVPEHVQFTAFQRIGKFDLTAMARWTKWSRFDILTIESSAIAAVTGGLKNTSVVDENWRNVWMFSGGVDYHINDKWTVRGGLAYDQGAVKNSKHRTARVPDNNRWIVSLGASYKKDNWQMDIGYSHMFWETSASNNLNGDTTLLAKYKTQLNMLGLSWQYNF